VYGRHQHQQPADLANMYVLGAKFCLEWLALLLIPHPAHLGRPTPVPLAGTPSIPVVVSLLGSVQNPNPSPGGFRQWGSLKDMPVQAT
jgi:hypothetical protein